MEKIISEKKEEDKHELEMRIRNKEQDSDFVKETVFKITIYERSSCVEEGCKGSIS